MEGAVKLLESIDTLTLNLDKIPPLCNAFSASETQLTDRVNLIAEKLQKLANDKRLALNLVECNSLIETFIKALEKDLERTERSETNFEEKRSPKPQRKLLLMKKGCLRAL